MNRNQQVTQGIILARTDYGEADRILTILTPQAGKLRLIAKGVRRVKSKLAGGIELFSVSDLTYIRGRGDIGTLVSARLQTHYGHIIEDIGRTMLGYELIKQLNKATEDEPEPDYFELLREAFVALDDATVSMELIQVWFSAQLLRLGGHTPNLLTEPDSTKLQADKTYEFSFDDMAFKFKAKGQTSEYIKFLRLLFGHVTARELNRIKGVEDSVSAAKQLVQTLNSYLAV